MISKPKKFFTTYEFRWIFLVYHATYITSNLSEHYCIPGLNPVISKLLSVFVVNTTLCVIKDKALT